MDVSCPNCRSEYEFDEARVLPQGVRVQCAQCAHVFHLTRPTEAGAAAVAAGDTPAPGGASSRGPQRDWKLRVSGGRVFGFKELTSLQKWIVEGKVSRDDEISLSGETWKRLGAIPELASFFLVFEAAARARSYESQALLPPSAYSTAPSPTPMAARPPPPPPPSLPPAAAPAQRSVPSFDQLTRAAAIAATTRASLAAEDPVPPPTPSIPIITSDVVSVPEASVDALASAPPALPRTLAEVPSAPTTRELLPIPVPPGPPPDGRPSWTAEGPITPAVVRHAHPYPDDADSDDEDLTQAVKGVGRRMWVGLTLAGLLIGGGLGYYFGIVLPEELRREHERRVAQREAPTPRVGGADLAPSIDRGAPSLDAGESAAVTDASTEGLVLAVGPAVDAGAAVDEGAAVAPSLSAAGDGGARPSTEVTDAGDTLLRASPGQTQLAAVVDAGLRAPEVANSVVGSPAMVQPSRSPVAPADAGEGSATGPQIFEWYLRQGDRLRNLDKADRALGMYERAIEMNRASAEALAGRGLALLDLDRLEDALAAFERALGANPRYAPALMGTAEVYRTQDKRAQAIVYYERFLRVQPKGSEANVVRSLIDKLKSQETP